MSDSICTKILWSSENSSSHAYCKNIYEILMSQGDFHHVFIVCFGIFAVSYIIFNIFPRRRVLFYFISSIVIIPILFTTIKIALPIKHIDQPANIVQFAVGINQDAAKRRKYIGSYINYQNARRNCKGERVCIDEVEFIHERQMSKTISFAPEIEFSMYREGLSSVTDVSRFVPLIAAIFIPVIGFVAKGIVVEGKARWRSHDKYSKGNQSAYMVTVFALSTAVCCLIAAMTYAAELAFTKMVLLLNNKPLGYNDIRDAYLAQFDALVYSLGFTGIAYVVLGIIQPSEDKRDKVKPK